MKVIVLGATGAVGTEVVKSLLQMPSVDTIRLLGRRAHPLPDISNSPKVQQFQVDVFDPATYVSHISGCDAAISTFGIGQPTKFTREEFIRADLDCVRDFAKACRDNGVRHFSSLGAVGANPKSSIFYVAVKGQLEQILIDDRFPRLSLFRPSNIITPTNRYGFSQAIVLKVHPLLDPALIGPLEKYRSIKVEKLGQAIAQNLTRISNQPVEVLMWNEFQQILGG